MNSNLDRDHFMPCPDPECEDGYIIVHSAYSSNPLKGEEERCDICKGLGVVPITGQVATAE